MSATEVVGLITSILALIVGLEFRIKALVKHYLVELKPNSGSSIKDQITRVEEKLDQLLEE
jgi:hypothetical protein